MKYVRNNVFLAIIIVQSNLHYIAVLFGEAKRAQACCSMKAA